jgi:O-antigen/teichoic acid export membrane protein
MSGTKGLGRRTRSAISWTAATAIASNAMRLIVLAVLGRLLAPDDFGIVTAAMTVIVFVTFLRDFGVGLALVQRKDLDREHVEVAFTVTMIQGLVLTIGIAALAGPICRFYGMEKSVDIVRGMSVLFVLRSVSLVPIFVMQRDMRFRELSLVDLFGYVGGAITSISLAYSGYGPFALVAGYTIETALGTIALVILAPPPWRMRWHGSHFRELLGFGIGKSLTNLGSYFALQGDYMVIGRVLDKTQLGLYQRAYELVRFPANVFSSVAGTVLFSAFAKVQDDPDRLGRALRRTTFASALFLLPASAGLIVLAPEVIRLLMGPGWGGAVWPLRIMAMSMMFRTTYKLGGLVGMSGGQVYTMAKWQFIYAAAVIGGASFSVQWGILGVSCTTSIAIALNFVALYWVVSKMTTLSLREVMEAHVSPIAFTFVVGAVAWAAATGLRHLHVPYVMVVALTTVAGAGAFALMLIPSLRRTHGDWPWLRETFVGLARRKRKKPQ